MDVKFIETTSDKLDSLPIVNGRFTFVKDKESFYRDTDTKRVPISGSDVIMTVDSNTLHINTRPGSTKVVVDEQTGSLIFNN